METTSRAQQMKNKMGKVDLINEPVLEKKEEVVVKEKKTRLSRHKKDKIPVLNNTIAFTVTADQKKYLEAQGKMADFIRSRLFADKKDTELISFTVTTEQKKELEKNENMTDFIRAKLFSDDLNFNLKYNLTEDEKNELSDLFKKTKSKVLMNMLVKNDLSYLINFD